MAKAANPTFIGFHHREFSTVKLEVYNMVEGVSQESSNLSFFLPITCGLEEMSYEDPQLYKTRAPHSLPV